MIGKIIRRSVECPFLWDFSRYIFELTNGIYKERIKFIESLGLLKDNPSVLDIGCGTGWCANVTNGYYVGIDFNPSYINYAKRKRYRTKKIFRCADLTVPWKEETSFDIVLLFDILHHLTYEQSVSLLKNVLPMAKKYLVNAEPIITDKNSILDRWIIKHDGGSFHRPPDELNNLFQESGYKIIKSKDFKMRLITTHITISCPERR